jgi:hypothetical protein
MSTIQILCYNCGVMFESSYTAPKSLICRSCTVKQAIAKTIEENDELLRRLED